MPTIAKPDILAGTLRGGCRKFRRLHYVAMARPPHLLCLAMRRDAFAEGELDILKARGWAIIDCRL
jgi:hypothetical protein